MAAAPEPGDLQRRVETLVRTTARTFADIARETGLPAATVSRWSKAHSWRPSRATASKAKPVSLNRRRRVGVERLYRNPAVALGDLATAIGVSQREAPAFFRTCGFGERRRAGPREPPGGMREAALQRSLRGHIARQIARFDAALTEGAASLDSAKVLRDLGGLKRLLDEIDADERVRGGGHGTRRLADPPAALDLPALRARIARRYAAFAGERPDAGLPGEPAG